MSGTALNKSMAEASKAAATVKNRHTGNFTSRLLGSSMADPDDEEDDSDGEGGELELWRLLPQLKVLPEAMLKKLPLSAMFQLNAALTKEKKTTEKMGVNSKLAKNAKQLARCPVPVEKGQDNRKDIYI